MIAHELAHVIQQEGSAPGNTSGDGINMVASLEEEAEQAAHAALNGTKARISRAATGVSFQGWPERDPTEDPLRTVARRLEGANTRTPTKSTPTSGAEDAVRGLAPKSANAPIDKENPTGNPYVDHGALCDADETPSSGCLLTKDQRARLIQNLQQRILVAQNNCKFAAAELRVDELVAKNDDGDWVTMMLLDLIVGYLGGRIAGKLASMRSDEATLEAVIASAGANVSRWKRLQASGAAAIKALSPERLTGGVEKAVDMTKQKVGGAATDNSSGVEGKKAQNIALIERFKNEIGRGFTRIREYVPASANDVELIALYHSFDEEGHTQAHYKEALAAKVERHRRSGVTMIGHLPVMGFPETFGGERGPNFYPKGQPHIEPDGNGGFRDERGVYVIWHVYKSGAPRQLVFQFDGVPRNLATGHGRFGGHNLPDGDPDRDSAGYKAPLFVPDEFVAEAISRHRQTWNDEPGMEVVDDTAWRYKLPPDIHTPPSSGSQPAPSSRGAPAPRAKPPAIYAADQYGIPEGLVDPLAKFPKI